MVSFTLRLLRRLQPQLDRAATRCPRPRNVMDPTTPRIVTAKWEGAATQVKEITYGTNFNSDA